MNDKIKKKLKESLKDDLQGLSEFEETARYFFEEEDPKQLGKFYNPDRVRELLKTYGVSTFLDPKEIKEFFNLPERYDLQARLDHLGIDLEALEAKHLEYMRERLLAIEEPKTTIRYILGCGGPTRYFEVTYTDYDPEDLAGYVESGKYYNNTYTNDYSGEETTIDLTRDQAIEFLETYGVPC